jgi:hypothetical protein
MARMLLQGDALREFNTKATASGDETLDNFQEVIKEVTKHVFPRKALVKQKRYLRRHLRKPRDLSIRQYVTTIVDMNEDFILFPDGVAGSKMPDDEIADIVESSCPNTWQRQMLIQGFDVTDHTLSELVDFLERLETAEDIYDDNYKSTKNKGTKSNSDQKDGDDNETQRSAKSKQDDSNKKKSNGNRIRSKKRRADWWCSLHEKDDHDEADCRVVQAQIKRMKASWKAGGYKNPNKKTRYSKEKEDESFNAFVDHATKEVMNRVTKKSKNKRRKKQVKFTDYDSSSDEEGCNQFSKLRISNADDSDSE